MAHKSSIKPSIEWVNMQMTHDKKTKQKQQTT